ncbi:ABC transporter ATP-binding protein [Bacillus salitolerans]|uniref:ABC transporter ATP-binding protein n=1 Tax=Bacillus salitolerans TaxID=1437434 RepID=A0ABW4LRP4_9BACI
MIKLENLEKYYISKNIKMNVLKGINLSINEGEMVAIMGRSGVGKSTLLNILAGLEKASNGKYFFYNQDISNHKYTELAAFRRKNVGFILQNHALIDEKNIFENVALPLLYEKKSKREIQEKVVSMLTQLGLLEKASQYPRQLSGGQSQRVAIGRALINDPKLILADEPTGSLDEETEQVILNLFEEINRAGKTFILVTHDEAVANKCNRIIALKDGTLVS